MSDLERFISKIERRGGCFEWVGYIMPNGYGQFRYEGKAQLSHRVSYNIFKGMIPEGLDIDHLCRNRKCVNPEHLEPVTRLENVRRGDIINNNPRSIQTHCKNGHEFKGHNLIIRKNGNRDCRECHKKSVKKYRSKK